MDCEMGYTADELKFDLECYTGRYSMFYNEYKFMCYCSLTRMIYPAKNLDRCSFCSDKPCNYTYLFSILR